MEPWYFLQLYLPGIQLQAHGHLQLYPIATSQRSTRCIHDTAQIHVPAVRARTARDTSHDKYEQHCMPMPPLATGASASLPPNTVSCSSFAKSARHPHAAHPHASPDTSTSTRHHSQDNLATNSNTLPHTAHLHSPPARGGAAHQPRQGLSLGSSCDGLTVPTTPPSNQSADVGSESPAAPLQP